MQGFNQGQEVSLSIVVRTRNEAGNLRGVFNALLAQRRCHFDWEVVVVDNESEDETLSLCKEYGARVVNIRRDEFTYGRALNLGISQARGELVMLLSAHSLPVGSRFLEAAVEAFNDPLIAAVRCLYVDNYKQMTKWYTFHDIQYHSLDEQRAAESGIEWTHRYPLATCCVLRRSVWEQVRFNEYLEANEDKQWASEVLSKGYRMRCCAGAVYVYTRKRRKLDRWRRNLREYRALYRLRGYVPLSWPRFALRVAKTFLFAPLVSFKYLYNTLAWNTYLVLVPWQARRPQSAGSHSEFEKGRYVESNQTGIQRRDKSDNTQTRALHALRFEEQARANETFLIKGLE